MEQSVQPGILQHFPCLLLQKPHLEIFRVITLLLEHPLHKSHLFSNDCELAASSGAGELVGLLDDLRQLHQVKLVLLPNLVRAHQLETAGGRLSWHQVYRVLQKRGSTEIRNTLKHQFYVEIYNNKKRVFL